MEDRGDWNPAVHGRGWGDTEVGVGRVRHDLINEQQAPKNLSEMLKLLEYRVVVVFFLSN